MVTAYDKFSSGVIIETLLCQRVYVYICTLLLNTDNTAQQQDMLGFGCFGVFFNVYSAAGMDILMVLHHTSAFHV